MSQAALLAKAFLLSAACALAVVSDIMTRAGVTVAAAGVVVAAVVAFFTIRNLQRSYWRNLVDERDAQIKEMQAAEERQLQARAGFAEEQRELRHKLKTELAALSKQLELEQAKSDLTAIVQRIDVLEGTLVAREPIFQDMTAGIHASTDMLRLVLEELREFLAELRQHPLGDEPGR